MVFGGGKKGRRGRAARGPAQPSYLRVMIARLAGYGQAVAAIGALVQSPRWDDEAWRCDLARQAAALRALHGELAEVEGVPKRLAEVHGAVLEASRRLQEALARLAAMGGQGSDDWPALAVLLADAGESLDRSAGLMSAELSQPE